LKSGITHEEEIKRQIVGNLRVGSWPFDSDEVLSHLIENIAKDETAQTILLDVVTDKEDLSEETDKRAVTLAPGLPAG
jgi:hypothetical protein